MSEVSSLCKEHIVNKHPKWKEEISKEAAENKNSPHTNPNWLRDLTGDFYNVVIANCSLKCKDATWLCSASNSGNLMLSFFPY